MVKHIYLIKSLEEMRYKIGQSSNPQKRLKELNCGSSSELILISTYKTEYYNGIEKALHRFFSHCRKNGEWFELTLDEEVKFIEKCQSIENNIKLLEKLNTFLVD